MLGMMFAPMFIALYSKGDLKQIAVVDNLTIAPSAEAIDAHGALAMVAQADVTTIF